MSRALYFLSKNVSLFLIASLTLGLAPFVPEPHIWGKLKWLWGGAVGMQPADWFDLVLHGTPWLLLIIGVFAKLGSKKPKEAEGG
jgi:hypothetical protein